MSVEGLDGAGLPNPCPHCGKHSTQPGTPDFSDRIVGYRCPYCSTQWNRSFEDGISSDDVVRVDLDDGYAYGGVTQIDGDRVRVWVDDPSTFEEWYDLWRIIVY